MASVTGSRLAFFGDGVGDANKINIVLTSDGINGTRSDGSAGSLAALAITGDLNIEVFTATPGGALASGYQASAVVQGAQFLSNNAVQAGTNSSVEEILASIPDTGKGGSGFTGNLVLDDFSGGSQPAGEMISIVGSGGQSYSVFGSAGDTITGSSNSQVSNYIDASGTLTPKNPPSAGGPFQGPETVTGGAGPTTVRGGTGDKISGGAGSLVVTDEHHDGSQTVTGGSGSLEIFQIGQKFSITGSSAGTTIIDDDYGAGGGSSIVGGSGKGLLSNADFKAFKSENTVIIAASTDQVTVGTALTYVDAFKGNISIAGGNGSNTGTVEGAAGFNTNILAGNGDKITLGTAATWVDASAGGTSITGGGPGLVHVEAGKGDSITGGSGRLDVNNIGNGDTIRGVIGNLFSFGKGIGESISGSQSGWTFIESGGSSNIVGGNGSATVPTSLAGGVSVNTLIDAGGGDTISGGTGSSSSTTFINAVADNSADTVTAGSGPTTVLAGVGDSVAGGSGTLEVDFDSDQSSKGTTIDLSKGTGATTLRDVSVAGGKGASVTVAGVQDPSSTVSGFPESSLTIASKTTTGAQLMASAQSDGKGGTLLTFNDKSTLDLVGVKDISKITFTS
jgi:hypothetical protein